MLLKPECEARPDIISMKFRGVGEYLTASLLNRLRVYIFAAWHTEYTLTEEVGRVTCCAVCHYLPLSGEGRGCRRISWC